MNEYVNPNAGARSVKASATTADVVGAASGVVRRPAVLNDAARSAAQGLTRSAISPVLLTGLARLLEFGVLSVAGFAVYWLYLASVMPLDGWYKLSFLAGPFITVAL